MTIYPHRDKAQHFMIADVSEQEMRNLLEGLQAREPNYQSPWTAGTIAAMQKAIEDSRQFHLNTKWQ